jgi:peptidyl-prolyl cis-trans isomerase D
MLDAIREHTQGWLAKVILAAITIPFALVGIDSYLRQAGSNVPIAKVGEDIVSVQEYGGALQNLRNQLISEGKTDPSVIEKPEVKQSVLDRLITNHLLSQEIKRAKFIVGDDQLSQYIIALPDFQENGKFSQKVYDDLLASNHLTPSKFEAKIRADLLSQQARQGLARLAYMSQPLLEQTLKTEHQQREVSTAEIKTADFVSQVKIDPSEVTAYYEKHKESFRVPEQVKLEFVLMSATSLITGIQVSEDEVKKYYQDNAGKFQGDEQRRASHILITFGVNPTPEAKAAAKKKAEDILAQIRKSPKSFEELARKYSQDPGSAEKGGDLGLFGRGAMVKPFEDTVYAMTPGTVSDVVESEFGYHIIKLTEISGHAQDYDSAKAQIKADILYQKALDKFTEQAENFSNLAYEQSSSLKPVADAFGLQVQTTDWLSRADGAKFFKSDKFISSVFSDEVLKEHRNTEAVEVSPNNLISARVVDYKPAAPRSFDEVKGGIEDYLKLEKAAQLAAKAGDTALASLQQGKEVDSLEWIPSVTVDRKDAQGLTDLAMTNLFKINTTKLPAYAGLLDGNKGYLLVKVIKVNDIAATDDTGKKTQELELKSALASEYVSAYVSSLRAKTKIEVNEQLLNAGTLNN